ncbi:hypothetical protein VST63_18340 [Mycolicibacterium sp. 050232]|uniref:hypothetical protein n=1 Tax=Mycolicibacterium sp. 050232 TaxID=3113982 RepID=UPI002E284FAB|nr:hypothetical protein [Mycolicibacterium sp. 050232]MED5814325.1 hypothetical protein [Mycolicibacterium sp. 050232]
MPDDEVARLLSEALKADSTAGQAITAEDFNLYRRLINALIAKLAGAARGGTKFVDDYRGSDPTGRKPSDAAVAAAIADLGTRPGVIEFGPGTYRLDRAGAELRYPGQYFRAQGIGLTTIDFRGDGSALKCWDSTTDPTGFEAPGRGGGILGGIQIDGTNNTFANSVGLTIGDLAEAVVERTLIGGFTGRGCIGFLGQNRYGWTEYGRFDVHSVDNTTCIVLEGHPDHPLPYGTNSWSYNIFDFGFSADADQDGVVVRNHVGANGVTWTTKFNCIPGRTNSGVAFTFGQDATDYVQIDAAIDWSGETTNEGAVAHTDMNWHGSGNFRGEGVLIFNDFSTPFVAGNIKPGEYKIVFSGRVDSPSLGHYSRLEIPLATIGDPGRFGARGDDANYIVTEENVRSYPVQRPKGPADADGNATSIGMAFKSQLAEGDTRKSLITIDEVNVVEALESLGAELEKVKQQMHGPPFSPPDAGGRPQASQLGVGARIYDTGLKKPLWSDGSVWRDAAGTEIS